MKHILALFLLSVLTASAATYYVSTNGSNANPGTQGSPWRNIGYSQSNVVAGDRVIVTLGEYNEFVTNTISGTAGNPITFEGEGTYGTVIDPSTDLSGGWSATSDFGSGYGIYKKTGLPFTVRELTIDNKRVAMVAKPGAYSFSHYISPAFTEGWQLLTNGASQNVTYDMDGRQETIGFWDGLEAIYCSTGSVCYLKLRDGSDPSSLSIRGAPNYDTSQTTTIYQPAILINNQSYITYSNFWIRNAFCGVAISGTSHNNEIVGCKLTAGYRRIDIETAYSNTIRSNLLEGNFYGFTNTGAWEYGTSGLSDVRLYNYITSKYTMGEGTSFEGDVDLGSAGGTNMITGNEVGGTGLGEAIVLSGDTGSPSFENEISYNLVQNRPSTGITLDRGQTRVTVHDNYIEDCNSNMRFHQFDYSGETDRTLWIYRNTFREPDGTGQHIFIHFLDSAAQSFHPSYWVYYNSFSGGGYGFVFGLTQTGGITNTFLANNIFSDVPYLYASTQTKTNGSWIGGFDYNLVYPSVADVAWNGTHSITNGPTWANSQSMSFDLSYGSPAINTALDVTAAFTFNGRSFSALPATGAVKYGAAWDMGALEWVSQDSSRSIRANTINIGNIRRQ